MDLHWLKPLLGRPAPFTTVYLDVTRAESAGEAEAADRWRGARRSLERDGASAAVLDEIGDLLAVPAGDRGPKGRVVVADRDGVVVDQLVSAPPAQPTVVHGPLPVLLPAVRAACEVVDYVVVLVDRSGADLHWSAGDSESVDGGHDDLHKTRDGLSRRAQTRAEDSWHRNAEVVAQVLTQRVAERAPELVLVSGDVRAVAMVCESVGQPVRESLAEVQGGARGQGAKQGAFHQHVADAVQAYRDRRRSAVLDKLTQGLGRGDGAVTTLGDVVEVLRRGQVDELVLDDEVSTSRFGDRELWVGTDPLQIATNPADLEALGVSSSDAVKLPAGAALVRAALGQDAGITFAPDGFAEIREGIGAVLRWSDGSTPHESLLTQSADQRRLRAT